MTRCRFEYVKARAFPQLDTFRSDEDGNRKEEGTTEDEYVVKRSRGGRPTSERRRAAKTKDGGEMRAAIQTAETGTCYTEYNAVV